jgi:hypothetical protein
MQAAFRRFRLSPEWERLREGRRRILIPKPAGSNNPNLNNPSLNNNSDC